MSPRADARSIAVATTRCSAGRRRRGGHRRAAGAGQPGDQLLGVLAQGGALDADRLQHLERDALVVLGDRPQQVLGLHGRVALAQRAAGRGGVGLLALRGQLVGVHRVLPTLVSVGLGVVGAPHDEGGTSVALPKGVELGLELGDPGLQGGHLVLELEHLPDALQAEAEAGQPDHLAQHGDVVPGVAAAAAGRAAGGDQPEPVVLAQGLGVQPGELGGHRDDEHRRRVVALPGAVAAGGERHLRLPSAARPAARPAGRRRSWRRAVPRRPTWPRRTASSGRRPATVTSRSPRGVPSARLRGAPFPLTRKVRPFAVPGGIFRVTGAPPRVGTRTSPPSAASAKLTGTVSVRLSPLRPNNGCGETATTTYRSPGGPPRSPGAPLPLSRIRWPSFTPAGMRTVRVRVPSARPLPAQSGHGSSTDHAPAAALAARLGEREAARVAAGLPGAVAGRAGVRQRAVPPAGAVAGRARLLAAHPQRHRDALDGLVERQGHRRLDVGTAPRTALATRTGPLAEQAAEHVTEPGAAGRTAEEVAEVEGLAARSAGTAGRAEPPGATGAEQRAPLVVLLAPARVRQHVVRLGDLLEPGLRLVPVGLAGAAVGVRVVRPGQLAVRLLDLVAAGGLGDAERLVEVLLQEVPVLIWRPPLLLWFVCFSGYSGSATATRAGRTTRSPIR